MKKIVALIEIMTAEEDKKFKEFLSSESWMYWHWIDGSWLILAEEWETGVCDKIRDKVGEIAPGRYTMVFEVGGVNAWAGYGAKSENRDMFKWIKENWQ